MRKVDDGEKKEKKREKKKRENKEKRMAFLVATTSLLHLNDDRWNAARSCQLSLTPRRIIFLSLFDL